MSIPEKPSTFGFSKRFYADVERETEKAREKFTTAPNHLDRDLPTKGLWISIIIEEVGKLSRCCNKLSIIPDNTPELKTEWNLEGQHRLITIASLCRRMAEQWDNLPDEHTGNWSPNCAEEALDFSLGDESALPPF